MSLKSIDVNLGFEPKPQLSVRARLTLAFSILSLVLASCGGRGEASLPVDNGGNGDGGGQAGEVESIPNLISDIRAEKIDLSQSEMDAFNTKLQNPETQVVKYVAQGDGYIVTEIDPEVRHDAVCLEQERWGVEGSDVVDLCSTLIEGQELILTNNDRDELVALMPFTVASGIEGYAGLAQDGKTIVPILARGSDDQIYVYNQDTLQYHPLGGETQILDILNIDELFLKNGGGTVVDSRSRGVGHVTRLRFKNGIEAIQTPDGSFVSPEFIALQDRIAASGERLILNPDGTIQDGATVVPGLAVDKNGVMTLLQGDSSQVTISPEDVSFDDEKGVSVAGYTLNEATGEWEPAVPTAESAAIALFDQYGVAPDTYSLAEVDGIVVGTDNETGTEIFRDGRFEIGFAIEIAKKDCEPTDFEPDKGGSIPTKYRDSSNRYLEKLLRDVNYKPEEVEILLFDILVDRVKKCWAFADAKGDALLYRDETGLGQLIPTIYFTQDELDAFMSNR